jgi:hypothetical protein
MGLVVPSLGAPGSNDTIPVKSYPWIAGLPTPVPGAGGLIGWSPPGAPPAQLAGRRGGGGPRHCTQGRRHRRRCPRQAPS